jgi:hypothetical protein
MISYLFLLRGSDQVSHGGEFFRIYDIVILISSLIYISMVTDLSDRSSG